MVGNFMFLSRLFVLIFVFFLSKPLIASNYLDNIADFKIKDSRILLFNRDTEIVDFSIILKKVGSAYEDLAGLSIFVDKMISMGPQSYNHREFTKTLEKYSISFNVYSTYDDLHINVRTIKKNLDIAVALISKAIYDTNFSDENFKLAKISAVSSIKNMYDDFQTNAYNTFFKDVFGKTIYGKKLPIVSDAENLELEKVKGFIKDKILKADFEVSFVGDSDEKSLANLLNKYFDFSNKSEEKIEVEKKSSKSLELKNWSDIKKIELNRGSFQSMIYFYINSLSPNDENFWKLSLLLDYIGGDGMSSLLMKKLRLDMNIAYTTKMSSMYFDFYNVASGYVFTSSNQIDKIVSEIKEIFKQVRYNGISEADLKILKNRFHSRNDMLFVDNASILGILKFISTNNLPVSFLSKMKNNLDLITVDDMNKFAKNFLSEEKYSFMAVH